MEAEPCAPGESSEECSDRANPTPSSAEAGGNTGADATIADAGTVQGHESGTNAGALSYDAGPGLDLLTACLTTANKLVFTGVGGVSGGYLQDDGGANWSVSLPDTLPDGQPTSVVMNASNGCLIEFSTAGTDHKPLHATNYPNAQTFEAAGITHPSMNVDCGMGCYNIRGHFTILALSVNQDAGYPQLSDFTVVYSETCTDLSDQTPASFGCVHYSSNNP